MINLLSKYRSELMGIATIMVMLFHYKCNFDYAPLFYLSEVGYGGVDMFLFLSGFGLWVGFDNTKIKRFFWRRFIRLYPVYLTLLLLWAVVKPDLSVGKAIVWSTGIGYWFPFSKIGFFDWYVPTMYVLYLVFPIVFNLCNKNIWGGRVTDTHLLKRVRCYIFLVLIFSLFLTGVLIYIQKGTVILTFSRIPVFLIGCYFGALFRIKKTISPLFEKVIITVSLFVLLGEIYVVDSFNNSFLWRNAIYFLPFAIITPGLLLISAKAMLLSDMKLQCITKSLGFVGKHSLEIYLIHIILLGYYKDWFGNLCYSHIWISFTIFLLIILALAAAYKKVLNYIINPIDTYVENKLVRKPNANDET